MKTNPTVVKAECSSCTAAQLDSPSEQDNTLSKSVTGIDIANVPVSDVGGTLSCCKSWTL